MTEPLQNAAVDIFQWVALVLALPMVTGMLAIAVGNSRQKHHETSANLQLCLFAWMALFTFLFGWWIRHIFISGPGITGGFGDASAAWPWTLTMGASIVPSENGAGLLRNVLELWLVAALTAAALVERIRTGPMLMLAAVGGVFASVCAAWMNSADGWLVTSTGFHDTFGAASIHLVAGGFTLGVLQILGGRVSTAGTTGTIALPSSNAWLSAMGRLILILGMIALAVSTLQPLTSFDVGGAKIAGMATAYGTPASLFGVTINLIFGVAAGILVGHVKGQGRIATTLTGATAGLVSLLSGADLLHPLLAFLIAAVVSWASLSIQRRLLDAGLDDAFGTISVHGASAAIGLVMTGVVAWGQPAVGYAGGAHINPFGNLAGVFLAFLLLGYLPGYLAAKFLRFMNWLRNSVVVEIAGQDLTMEVADSRAMAVALERERTFAETEIAISIATGR